MANGKLIFAMPEPLHSFRHHSRMDLRAKSAWLKSQTSVRKLRITGDLARRCVGVAQIHNNLQPKRTLELRMISSDRFQSSRDARAESNKT